MDAAIQAITRIAEGMPCACYHDDVHERCFGCEARFALAALGEGGEPVAWGETVTQWYENHARGLDCAGTSEATHFEAWARELREMDGDPVLALVSTHAWCGLQNQDMRDEIIALLHDRPGEGGERVEGRLVEMASRYPYVAVSHGDGSEEAAGCQGWECEIVTGAPYGAVWVEGHDTLAGVLESADDRARAILHPKDERDREIAKRLRRLARCRSHTHTKAGHSDLACFRCSGSMVDPEQWEIAKEIIALSRLRSAQPQETLGYVVRSRIDGRWFPRCIYGPNAKAVAESEAKRFQDNGSGPHDVVAVARVTPPGPGEDDDDR